MNRLLLFAVAAIAAIGLVGWIDKHGDAAAYRAAEAHLLAGAELKRVFGADVVAERTGGSVAAGQVVNWNGVVRGNGLEGKAAVGMHRVKGEEKWIATRARFRFSGEDWRDAYPPAPEPAQPPSLTKADEWQLIAAAHLRDATAPLAPTQDNPVPALDHKLVRVTVSLAKEASVDEALQYTDSVRAVTGSELVAAYAGARALQASDRLAESVARMRRHIDRNQDDGQAWTGLARIYAHAGQWPNVLPSANRALDIDAGNRVALFLRGMAWFNLAERAQALQDFRQACRLGDVLGCRMQQDLANQ